ncbi:MAG: hypothetical protein J3K34DRAFT_468165 [Monoraphidium minutum]|nr:MAG: hypothetical protein J3K34DRAFT_468165 [Monoraphidium minutum]
MSAPCAALVTGGATGIGFAVARALAGAGYGLTLLGRRQAALDDASAKLRAEGADVLTATADARDARAQAAAFAAHGRRFGRLDVAVLSAGVFRPGSFLDGEPGDDSWQEMLDVNLKAAMTGVRLAARQMAPGGGGGGGGVIVSIASAAGVLPLPGAPAYSAAKGGLVHFTRSMAWPLAERGVTIAAVCPQYVDTSMIMAPWGVFGLPLLTTARVVAAVQEVIARHESEGPAGRLARRAELERGAGCIRLLLQKGGGTVVDPYAGFVPGQ